MFSSSVRVWKTHSRSSESLASFPHRRSTASSSPTSLLSTRLSVSSRASSSLSSTLSPSSNSERTRQQSLVTLVFSCASKLTRSGTPSCRISEG